LADQLKERIGSGVLALASAQEGKVSLMAVATPDIVERGAHMGKLIKEMAALCGGGGGGRPDSAMAGGKDLSKLGEALTKAPAIIGASIKK
jgi:alanyl-tRNA synthetase